MKPYFTLQCKRVSKVFVSILTVTLVLAVGISVALVGMISSHANSDENKVFIIGITGDMENEYLKWGLAAVQAFDDTRFSMQFVQMEEEEAIEKLSNGILTAYICLPSGFVEGALTGELEPIRFVTTPGASGVVTMFKNEITSAIVETVIDTQKGTNGIGDAAVDQGVGELRGDLQYNISLKYVELILSRGDMVTVDILGISNGLSLVEYYICGFALLFLMLMGLPFVTIYTRKDDSLNRLLLSKGFSFKKQVLCEWAAHFLSLLCLVLVISLLISCALLILPENDLIPDARELLSLLLYLIPVIVMLSAFNLMLFEISKNVVSGVLLHFFSTLLLCYISGCLYPIYAFPEIIQKLDYILPTGVARANLASAFVGECNVYALMGTLVMAFLFYAVTVASRTRKTLSNREA